MPQITLKAEELPIRMGAIKGWLRSILNFLHIDLTKNLEYDRLTKRIISRTVGRDSVCVDVGAYKGEILQTFMKYAPEATHIAFEPLPDMYEMLRQRFNGKCTVYPYALGSRDGTTAFQHVKNAPAFSGFMRRTYHITNPEIEQIIVEQRRLDSLLNGKTPRIDFIKIDVEGGEFQVLRGAEETIRRNKPFVLFEFGLGGSEYYGTQPADIYGFFRNVGMKISTLQGWLDNPEGELTAETFSNHFNRKGEYYFLAHP